MQSKETYPVCFDQTCSQKYHYQIVGTRHYFLRFCRNRQPTRTCWHVDLRNDRSIRFAHSNLKNSAGRRLHTSLKAFAGRTTEKNRIVLNPCSICIKQRLPTLKSVGGVHISNGCTTLAYCGVPIQLNSVGGGSLPYATKCFYDFADGAVCFKK